MGRKLEVAIGILNGAVGDYLCRTGNGLATPMQLLAGGCPLAPEPVALARAIPAATPRAVILVHGLMTTETVWSFPDGSDYGSLLGRDLGYTPLYLRYNSGRAIAENGAALAGTLDAFASAYPAPLEEILLLGYSMGGLVARSACRVARLRQQGWLARVRRAIYVATPHRGAPLERIGRTVARILGAIDDPYTRLLAEIGNLRSAGLQDLGDGDPVPLLPEIEHFLVAGTIWEDRARASLVGDALVPVPSAIDHARHTAIVAGAGHLDLAHHPAVYDHIRRWLGGAE